MSPIISALIITALGMGIVFVGIVLLWGMMALIVRIFQDKPEVEELAEGDVEEPAALISAPDDRKRRAAAAAVAVALSMHRASSALVLQPPSAALSPWQSAARTRQMQQRVQPPTRKK